MWSTVTGSMERTRDLQRASVSSARRWQRVSSFRNSPEEEMELQETVRLRDRERERIQKKDRSRELAKRRRVERCEMQRNEECTDDSSDEEYYETEGEVRWKSVRTPLSNPTSSSSSIPNNNSRRSLRSLRSAPVLKSASVDELIGVPVPRRARSFSARRLSKCWSLSGGGFMEEFGVRRRKSPPPVVSAGGLLKKKKSMERRAKVLKTAPSSSSRPHPSSVKEDDIEIEVAEALFDLMTQSQSQSPFPRKTETPDRDSENDLKSGYSVGKEGLSRVEDGKMMVESREEVVNKDDEKEKFPDEGTIMRKGDWSVNKGKVVVESSDESASRVQVKNACEIPDPTSVSKADDDGEATLVENKKEAKLEIDLMAPPPLPSSPERDGLVNLSSDVQKEETINMCFGSEKNQDGISCVTDGIKHQREQKYASPTTFMPFPIAMGGCPGVLPQQRYMPPVQTILPMDGSARSSKVMQPPPFKFSQPQAKKCATHQRVARSIHQHKQLINMSLSSASTAAATSHGTKPLNINAISSKQELFPGNLMVGGFRNLGTNSAGTAKDRLVLQQAPYQTPTSNFVNGPAVIFPLAHHETRTVGSAQSDSVAGSSGLASHSAGGASVNSPLPGKVVTFNPPNMPSSEALPYMAILQNGGCPVPISTSVTERLSLKGGKQVPTVPFFNHSFYSSPVFRCQQQLSLQHPPLVQSVSQNTSTSSSNKQPPVTKTSGIKFPASGNAHSINQTSFSSFADTSQTAISNSSQTCSFAVPPLNFCYANNKHVVDPQKQGSKDGVQFFPQAFALSFGPNASSTQPMAQQGSAIFQMLPPQMVRNGNQIATTPFHTAQHKYFQQACEGKSGVIKGTIGKSPNSVGQPHFAKSGSSDMSTVSKIETSSVDSVAQSVNIVPSALIPSSSAAIANFQQYQHQQQLIQLQKHHFQQMQKAAATSNSIAGSNFPVFPQVTVQSDNAPLSPQLANMPRTSATDEITQQLKSSLGQKHISFANGSVSAAASLQGQQIIINS